MPSPSARPRTNTVLPAPREPVRLTMSPGFSDSARRLPSAAVSSSDSVKRVSSAGSAKGSLRRPFEVKKGLRQVVDDVAGDQRRLTIVLGRQVARQTMRVDAEQA